MHLRVLGDLIHALTDADHRRERVDGINSVQRRPNSISIADVS
jgi:hypothetical protein